MNASPEQIVVLRKLARSLGALREEVVLVGGIAAAFLVTDPGADEPRETNDVDLIIEVTSKVDYYGRLRNYLLSRGFREAAGQGVPLCRWLLDGLEVDVMPTEPEVLGFSNDWYSHAIATSTNVMLPSSEGETVEMRLISAPAFCATKLASYASRGGGDLLHHDIQDIIAVVDGRKELVSEIEADAPELRAFVAQAIANLFQAGLEEHIASHLPGDRASQERQPFVLATLRRIVSLRVPGS